MNHYDTICFYTQTAKGHIQNAYLSASRYIGSLDLDIHWAASLAFKSIAVAFAARLNPVFFGASFFIGLTWHKEVRSKFEENWNSFKDNYYKVIAAAILMSVIHLQVALVAYPIWIGARFGASLKKNSVDETTQTASASETG